MSGTEEAAQGEPPRVFNCSSVGYPALRAAAVVAQKHVFLDLQVLQDSDFPDLVRSALDDFSHPYFPYPWKNIISGEICLRTFLSDRQ